MRLSDGAYFNMNVVASEVWGMIAQGATLAQIVAGIADSFEATSETVQRDVEAMLDELLLERLVITAPADESALEAFAAATARDTTKGKADYAAPTVNAYRDMTDLLALDPPFGPDDCRCGALDDAGE
jgi:hypothetical protein